MTGLRVRGMCVVVQHAALMVRARTATRMHCPMLEGVHSNTHASPNASVSVWQSSQLQGGASIVPEAVNLLAHVLSVAQRVVQRAHPVVRPRCGHACSHECSSSRAEGKACCTTDSITQETAREARCAGGPAVGYSWVAQGLLGVSCCASRTYDVQDGQLLCKRPGDPVNG